MLLPYEINYYDLYTISCYSGKGWPEGDWFLEDIVSSYEIMIKAIDRARNESK